MSDSEAVRTIAEMRLQPHPEGGWYRELYRSASRVTTARGERSALTVIHFLLERGAFSALHRLRSDETWHFVRGGSIAIETIARDGARATHVLCAHGPTEVVIAAGTLFGARVGEESPGYALVSCCVAPGFEFEDFEMPPRAELVAAFPAHAELIGALTRREGPAQAAR